MTRYLLLLSLLLLSSCLEEKSDDPPTPPVKPVAYSRDSWLIRGEPTLLLSGTFDTYRIPPAEWERRLRMMRQAGLNTVDLYVAWNVHEPKPGEFDFTSPRADLERFFALCEKLGLYVYFRPGPFICNETDGGGLPAWLFVDTTEDASEEEDGKVRVREKDADFLKYVSRYFGMINKIVKAHQLTDSGGCVILYALANEHDWYALMRQLYRLGTPPDVPAYMSALRDMVRDDGITVPLTTAQGEGVSWHGTGNVSGIVPCPNLYDVRAASSIEGKVHEVLATMHSAHSPDMPSLISETERSATRVARVIYGGMDGINLFNFNGFPVAGYENGMTLDFSLGLGLTPANLLSTLRDPKIGYFPGQIDYRCPISARGSLREKYYRIRRVAQHFSALSSEIAAAGVAKRGLAVSNLKLGTLEGGKRTVYWLQNGATRFFGLLNQTDAPQSTTVTIDGETWPRFSKMIVGTGVARVGAPHEKWVSKQLVHRLPLAKGYPMLEYSSSELFTRFTEGGRTVVVLSGGAGTPGELCLSGMAGATLLHDSLAGTLHEKGDRWTWSYSHTADRLLVFDVGGKKLVLLITTTAEAGRLWRLTDPSGKTWLLSDARFASKVGSGPSFDAEWDGGGDGTVLVLGPRAPKELVLGGSSLVGKRVPSAGAWIGKVAVSPVYPPAPALGGGMAVSEPEADDSGWSATDSGPAKLEALGIYKGHAWYRTDFEATSLPGTRVYFRAGKAAGIISGWLNGKYFGTAFPKGTGLEMSIPRKHFKLGKNVLAFRVQIWGHSSFEIPTVPGVLDFPALQVAFPRGLWDGASLASMFDMWKVSLSLPWRYRAGLHGERHHWAGAVDPAGAVEAKLPLSLSSGATVWYRTTLAGPTLPPKTLRAPLVLALEGEGLIATVFVNGVLIGRWISDNETLASDSYGNGRRDQWVPEEISYDEIYVPRSLLHGGTNVVALALESLVKGPYARRGAVSSKLRSLSLRYSADGFDKTKDGGHLRSVSLPLTVHE